MGSNQESDPFADLLGLGDLKEKSKSPRRQSMASQSSKGGLLAGVGATSSGDWMLFESDAAGGSSTPHGAIRPSDLDLSASPSFGSDATFSPQASAGMGPSSANWVSFDSPGERKTNVGGGRASSDNDLADFASFSSEPAYGEAAATSLPARQDSEPPSYFEVTQQAGVPVLQHVAGKRFESLDSMGPAQSSGSATWSPWQLPGESSEDGRNSVPKHAALGSSKSLLQETESFRSMMKKAWMATPPAFCNLRLPPIRSSPSTSYVSCMAILGNELVVGVCKEVRTWRLDAVGKELSEIESESEKYEVLSTPDEWHQSKRPTAMFAEPFRLWCGFDDGTVVLWHKNDSDQWKVEYAFNATRSAVTALAVVGHYLWTGSESGNVCLWKLKEIDRMRQGLDFTTDLGQSVKQFCRRLSTPVTSGAASTKPHSSVQWMLQSNKLIYSFGAHVMVVWDQHGNFRGRLNCVDSEGVRYENWAEDDHGAPSNVRRGKQGFLRKIVGKSHLMLRTRNMVKAGAANVLATVGRTMAAAADYATASGTGSESGVAFKRARVTSTCSGADNSVWVGYSDGWLRLWNSGICVAKLRLGRKALRAICPVRKYLWIGSKLGLIFIVEVDVPNEDDENGSVNLRCISCWRAHQYSLLHIVSGRAQVVTCDTLGNIKSWPRTAPIERDNTIEIELQRSKPHFTSACDITVFATTWNVNESKPSDETIAEWLRGDVEASDVVVIGLQEIETGGGAVVGQAVKNVTGNVRDKLMKPSATGSWWIATLNRHLTGLRGVRQFDSFCLAGSKQLAGILLCVWVRNSIKDHTSEPTSAVVTCGGPGRSLANKGVVGISLCIHRQRLTFLNSHLAAHQNAVEARNEDYHHILSNIHFYSQSHLDVQEYSSELMATDTDKSFRNHKKISDDHSLVDSDLVVWIGDLNYRIDAPYEVWDSYGHVHSLAARATS